MESRSQARRIAIQKGEPVPRFDEVEPNKLFVYGILKRGLELDLTKYGCKFLGEASLPGARLYAIHSGVGLRFSPDPKDVAYGEVFEIHDGLWHNFLDGIESNGYVYTRKVVTINMKEPNEVGQYYKLDAWVYEHVYWPSKKYEEELEVIPNGRYR